MPRLFAGIEIPPHIAERLASLKAPLPGARWIEPQNMHLTLRFAGDVDAARARELADALAAIDADAFEMRIEGLGTFGGNEPRSLWAGIAPCPALEALARACERAARVAGVAPAPHAFKPHISIARLRHTRIDALARFMQRNANLMLEPVFVPRFVLFSSRPQVGGGPYVVEEAYTLRGGEVAEWAEHEAGW